MKVYVLETGCYEDASTYGVFASPEAAMAVWHPEPHASTVTLEPPRTVYDSSTGKTTYHDVTVRSGRAYTWSRTESDRWVFDADFDHAADITEYEVQT